MNCCNSFYCDLFSIFFEKSFTLQSLFLKKGTVVKRKENGLKGLDEVSK